MTEQIVFSNPGCKRTGFLSNAAYYSFLLDDKLWPTVEHYMTAKRFEGTKYEEVIRTAPTVYQVQRLSRVKSTAKGEYVFGRGSCKKEAIYEKGDWSKSKHIFIKKALREKFQQNPSIKKKLMETTGFKLVDVESTITGPALESIRASFAKDPIVKKKRIVIRDFPTSDWVYQEIVDGIIKLGKRIALVEGCKEFIDDMFDDLLFNLVPVRETRENLEEYITQTLKIDFTTVYTRFPNYIFIYQHLKKLYNYKHIRKISIILLWISHNHEKDYKFPKSRMQIKLQPRKRWYRKIPV